MATAVKIPPMGESITGGVLAKWHVKDGDFVKPGQTLFELETDKITSEGTASVAGAITLQVKAGDEVAISQVVAIIDEKATVPVAKADASSSDVATEKTLDHIEAPGAAVSPAVRRIGAETGVNPADILPGTGKDGRVTKGDMLAATSANKGGNSVRPFVPTPNTSSKSSEERTSRRKMTSLRRRIAERLVAVQHETASLTTFNEVDMSAVMAFRQKHQETFVAKYGVKIGFMSFFVKAVVKALKDVPQINAQLDGEEIIDNHFYDISVAIGTEKGLVVPVVRDCDHLNFADIERAIGGYAKKARDGKLALEDLQGGVFTITNGGTYGSLLSTPILNSPQSAILGMHSIQQRPVVVDGQIVIRPMMYVALTYDHRIVDGKEAVTFLVKVKESIENPLALLMDI
jgi:2-oxoglutarate dehydrogenase E2 component (dihydrolipoamide succinyltransferase)